MLDRDATVRRLLEKSENMGSLISFVEKALSRGWKIDWLLGITTRLWNNRIMALSAAELEKLVELLQELIKHDVDPKNFVAETMARALVQAWINQRRRSLPEGETEFLSLDDFKNTMLGNIACASRASETIDILGGFRGFNPW